MTSRTEKNRRGQQQGVYVYCIIASSAAGNFGQSRLGGGSSEVYTVHYEKLAAVVSVTPLVIYDPTRENVLAHEDVVENVMREFTVLPMAFGTLFRSERDVVEIMRRSYDALRKVLAQVKGKVEYGLKVSWDRERVLAEIERESKEISRLKQQLISGAGGSTYHTQIELGRLVEAALTKRAERYIRDIHASLGETAAAANAGKPIGDKMIMNGAFLVGRAHADEFHRRVDQLAAKYQGELSFKPSGPWPPYNFVRIRLQAKG